MASNFKPSEPGKTWKDSLTSELGYLGMISLGLFLYSMLALISLSLTGTVGKLSPIQFSVQNNGYLFNLLEVTGINRASPGQLQFCFYVILVFLFLDFAWAILYFSRRQNKGLLAIMCFATVISTILIFTPPLASKDLFSYIYYGRIGAVYNSNPYVISPQKFPFDPLLAYVSLNWKNTAVVYGPIFTITSMFLTAVAGNGITANIYAYKLVMVLFNLANVILIWYLLGLLAPRRQRLGTMIYAWNPLVLIHIAGGGHNDAMMMTFALIAMVFLLRGRRYLGYAFLCLSVMVKYTTIVLVISYVIYDLAHRKGWKDRLRELAIYAAILLFITAALMLPFWDGFATLDSLRQNLNLHNCNIPGGWCAALAPVLLRSVFRLPADLAQTLGKLLTRLLLYAIFFFVLVRASLKCKDPYDLPDCFFYVTLVFILVSSFFQPWYLLWLLPFLVLRPWDRMSQTVLYLGTGTMAIAGLRPY